MSVVWMVRACWLALALLAAAGCAAPAGSVRIAGQAGIELWGLGPCDGSNGPLTIDPHQPVVVLVHGCNASAARFRSLAQVFALHGQQAACFEYDDRARIRRSAGALRSVLEQLAAHLDGQELVVLGHSQGGLVARAALVGQPLATPLPLRLVTVSSPFNGIRAARDCGSRWLHIATLGLTVGVCRVVTGAKWNEIHPRARGVVHPEELARNVSTHLRVVTDERNTCRTLTADRRACIEDDFVFSIAEQDNLRMDADERLKAAQVAAGHAEIVGNDALKPLKLIAILQEHRVMRPTPPDKRVALAKLLERLF